MVEFGYGKEFPKPREDTCESSCSQTAKLFIMHLLTDVFEDLNNESKILS